MRKRIVIYFIFIMLFIASCERNKSNEQSTNQNLIPKGNGRAGDMVDEIRDFSSEYLQSLDYTGELFIPNENVWDVEAYKKYKKYFPLTADEERIVGVWEPIPEKTWTEDKYKAEGFAFWPNKLCIVEFGAGYMIGLWGIKDEKLFVTIYGISYPDPSGGQGYVKESINPFTTRVVDVRDISPVGYSRRRFSRVPVPEKLAAKFPGEIFEGKAYHYKSLVSFSGATGIEYFFMERMQDFLDAGNPTAEDIVKLKVPNAKELW